MRRPTMNHRTTPNNQTELRVAVHQLAEAAFHQHLISGHGDGEYPNKYQIVYQGKPRHFSLQEAHDFLRELLTAEG
ncbi:MAG: hypothetical protein NW220_09565 [Leptolyngbyaceae cyanobacterium bins.349]|nr:hypothetical protein [Leptolyngbyaceae cyanobacterium bins.349]